MPVRRFDLPSHLAKGIAGAWGKPDLSAAVVTTAMRPALKNVALPDKLGTLDGTLRVDRQAVDGHVVLLVDDCTSPASA